MSIITPEFRVSFPQIFEPKSINGSAPKYSIVMLFPKGCDLTDMVNAIKAAGVSKFPDDKGFFQKLALPFPTEEECGYKLGLKDQNFKRKAEKYEGYEAGAYTATATAKNQPGVVDANLQRIINPEDIYPGCWARAQVNIVGYDAVGNGVGIYLNNLQKTRDDDRLDSRQSAESVFTAVDVPSGGDASDLFG